jgi:hypothetical protein
LYLCCTQNKSKLKCENYKIFVDIVWMKKATYTSFLSNKDLFGKIILQRFTLRLQTCSRVFKYKSTKSGASSSNFCLSSSLLISQQVYLISVSGGFFPTYVHVLHGGFQRVMTQQLLYDAYIHAFI